MNPDRDLEVDLAKFDFFFPLAYPQYAKSAAVYQAIKQLMLDDILQLGQLHEQAISKQAKGKMLRESTVGKDFYNGDDAKLISVRTSGYGQVYSAPIAGIHAKTGNLLASCYERKQKKWYFFKIPYHAYKNIPKTSNIDIPFEMNGDPRRIPRRSNAYCWWDHEVKTFKDLFQ